jgi:hypothetical protein
MRLTHRVLSVIALLALTVVPARAQEYTYHTATKMNAGGALGFMAKMGGGKEQIETAYLSGHKLRTEQENFATIVDADAASITTINKKDKTYYTMTFEEMAAMMRDLQAQQKASMDKEKDKGKGDVELKYTSKVDATGKQENINGNNAKQVFVTLSIDAAARPEGEKDMQQAGTMTVLMEMWNSTDVPHANAMRSFQETLAKKAAKEMGSMRGMEAMFSMYPGAKEGMEAAAAEMKKVPGVPVRTTTYMVLVPAGQKLDRELVLAGGKKADEKAGEEKKESKGLGGFMNKMKKAAEAKQAEGDGEGKTASQSTVFSVTSELKDVQAGGVPADAFSIPAGYKEQKPKYK